MKTNKYFILLFMLLAGRYASAQQILSAELQVAGLTCSMCSQATEKSLKSLDFIESIKPDLNKNTFVINFKKTKPVSLDLIRKKVQDAGFSIANMEAVFNLNNIKVDEAGQAIVGPDVYKFLNAKNRTLNGEIKASVVDKNFISASSFKQKARQFNTGSYGTGYGTVNGRKTRIYHLVI